MTEKSVIDWMYSYTIPKVLPDIERTIGIAGEVIIIFFLSQYCLMKLEACEQNSDFLGLSLFGTWLGALALQNLKSV